MKANPNNVMKLREAKLMSKAELARKAGVSVLTVDRIEKGFACRLDTKRKIVLALGLRVSEADKVFRNSQKSEPGTGKPEIKMKKKASRISGKGVKRSE